MYHPHVLSVTDIQLIVDLFETQDVVKQASGREHQIDNLIRMGYLRPMRGIFTLTELGEKTARSLQARQFVPSRSTPPAALASASPHATAEAGDNPAQEPETAATPVEPAATEAEPA